MSSLTAPHDRDSTEQYKSNSTAAPLTDSELDVAREELDDTSLLARFPRIERFYADPIYNNQTYSLHSFIPAKGATPDEHGIYGFMKCRGSFMTSQEAAERAEWIIRNADSYHSIQTTYTGRPFPVCQNTRKYAAETNDVDIRKQAVDTISEDIRKKKEMEKREIEDIKMREEKLMDESKDDYVPEPLEQYTTLQVKRANLVWTYLETQRKMRGMRNSIRKTMREIQDMDGQDQQYRQQYYERYMDARKAAGITDVENPDNFIKYMMEDVELDFDVMSPPEETESVASR